MHADSPAAVVGRPGLIWGFDLATGAARPLGEADCAELPADGAYRWLHLNLADQRSGRWLAGGALAAPFRDLLLAPETRPRLVFAEGAVGGLLPDIERDFASEETRIGMMRFVAGPRLMITARLHPVRSADLVRHRLAAGAAPRGPAAVLDLLLVAMGETAWSAIVELEEAIQGHEERLLDHGDAPDARTLTRLRAMMARLHRGLGGARAVIQRHEPEAAAHIGLWPVLHAHAQRVATLDAEIIAAQTQLRSLRDDLDLQASQRTNQNLYVLSIMTALMAPASLVTGFFGMNTGGLPWGQTTRGALLAGALMLASSAATYVSLRLLGLIRR